MSDLARLEVTETGPLRTTVAYFSTDVAPELSEALRPVIEGAVAEVAAVANLHDGDARLLLAGEVARLVADAEAYQRESARRGVLAL